MFKMHLSMFQFVVFSTIFVVTISQAPGTYTYKQYNNGECNIPPQQYVGYLGVCGLAPIFNNTLGYLAKYAKVYCVTSNPGPVPYGQIGITVNYYNTTDCSHILGYVQILLPYNTCYTGMNIIPGFQGGAVMFESCNPDSLTPVPCSVPTPSYPTVTPAQQFSPVTNGTFQIASYPSFDCQGPSFATHGTVEKCEQLSSNSSRIVFCAGNTLTAVMFEKSTTCSSDQTSTITLSSDTCFNNNLQGSQRLITCNP